MTGATDFTLVVPAYDEATALPRLLDSVDAARGHHEGRVDVVVADNGSTDGTADVAAARGCRVVPVERRMIAAARNGGARAAETPWLVFCDADIELHPATFAAMDRRIRAGGVIGGATGVRYARTSVGIAVTYWSVWPVAMALGIEAGPMFVAAEDFWAVGGYPEDRSWAEDVVLQRALIRRGRGDDRRFVRVPEARATASTRKFDALGDWHMFRFPAEHLRDRLAGRGETTADRYWYDDPPR